MRFIWSTIIANWKDSALEELKFHTRLSLILLGTSAKGVLTIIPFQGRGMFLSQERTACPEGLGWQRARLRLLLAQSLAYTPALPLALAPSPLWDSISIPQHTEQPALVCIILRFRETHENIFPDLIFSTSGKTCVGGMGEWKQKISQNLAYLMALTTHSYSVWGVGLGCFFSKEAWLVSWFKYVQRDSENG